MTGVDEEWQWLLNRSRWLVTVDQYKKFLVGPNGLIPMFGGPIFWTAWEQELLRMQCYGCRGFVIMV